MSAECSLKEAELRFYFVVEKASNKNNLSEDMGIAYQHLCDYLNGNESITFTSEEETCEIIKSMLNKKHIFIFNEFSGKAFKYLEDSGCVIVGPKCLISCLIEAEPVPLTKSPVFTTAMRNLNISGSGYTVDEKAEIRKLVSWMGGYYSSNLTLHTTHLISKSVKTEKYEKAALDGIPIMHIDWIYDVWERSKIENISATHSDFDKHKLPLLYGLKITTTGFKELEREKIAKTVTGNGGEYIHGFKSSSVDILILTKENVHSEKYKVARKCKKDCVVPEWLTDSILKGYALPLKHYVVYNMEISTPSKSSSSSVSDFNPDASDISAISVMDTLSSATCTINETVDGKVKNASKLSLKPSQPTILEEIETEDVKKAGVFLDGYCIALVGFSSPEKEKLNKILNSTGAVRYDDLNDKVSHVIVGEITTEQFKKMKITAESANFITANWLVDSIKQKKPAEESNYLFKYCSVQKEPEAPSPSSKKTIQSMNNSFKKPTYMTRSKKQLNFEASSSKENTVNNDHDEGLIRNMISEYSSNSYKRRNPINSKSISLDTNQEDDEIRFTEDYRFLEGLIIYIFHTEDHYMENVQRDCENCKGIVVDERYKDEVDYVIVSSEHSTDPSKIPMKYKNIVNDLWLDDAIQNNKIVDKMYYHDIIPTTADKKPLTDMNIVVSLYQGNERTFIIELATTLGATIDDAYYRKYRPLLICPEPKGDKYDAALKWKYPAVTSKWLIDCAKQGAKLSYSSYLVGCCVKDFPVNNETQPRPSTSEQSNISFRLESGINKNVNTLLRHPRVNELGGTPLNRKRTSSDSDDCDSPKISINTRDHVLNVSDYVKESEFATPQKEVLYKVLKEMQAKETPQSEKLKKFCTTPGKTPPTPKIPEYFSTPEVFTRSLGYYNRFYIPIEKEKFKPDTPLNEYRQRYWREALGDEYLEYIAAANTQTQRDSQHHMVEEQFNKHGDAELQESRTSKNLELLNDFIEKHQDKKLENAKFTNNEDLEINTPLNSADIESQNPEKDHQVEWVDPSEFTRKKAKLEIRYKGTPRFSIFCSNTQTHLMIVSSIKELKGEVCEDQTQFDETCTHLVCEDLNRGERMMSSIASGKWILSAKYIEDSKKAGYFLNEEEYEFGNPIAKKNLPELEPTKISISNAAYRWRKIIATNPSKNNGAFTGFRVILHVNRIDSFRRLIQAGGGIVQDIKSPFSKCDFNKIRSSTHCFVDHKSTQLKKVDEKVLLKAGVPIVTVMYLNAYLSSSDADISNFFFRTA